MLIPSATCCVRLQSVGCGRTAQTQMHGWTAQAPALWPCCRRRPRRAAPRRHSGPLRALPRSPARPEGLPPCRPPATCSALASRTSASPWQSGWHSRQRGAHARRISRVGCQQRLDLANPGLRRRLQEPHGLRTSTSLQCICWWQRQHRLAVRVTQRHHRCKITVYIQGSIGMCKTASFG